VWAVRPGVDVGDVPAALVEAKRRGLSRAARIAEAEAPKLGLDAGFCRRYLSNILSFDLGPRELAGLERFRSEAAQLGLVPATSVPFLTAPQPAEPSVEALLARPM
jgi:chorismate dehydratase